MRSIVTSIPRWVVPLLAAAGIGLLVALVVRLDAAVVAEQVSRLGPILPAVLALTAAKYVLQTQGWRLVLAESKRPPWFDAIRATIAGDAVGYLTWAGPFSGEPTRALLTRHVVPVGEGIAAGAAERAIYNLTAAILVVVVLVALALTAHPAWQTAFWTTSLAVLAATALTSAFWRRRPSQAHRSLGRQLNRVRQFWHEHRHLAPALGVLCVAQHALLVLEAFLMLVALNAQPTMGTTLAFEAVTKVVNTAGVIVPARIGISEGGSALLAGALGYQASLGLSLALMRRVRAVIWSGIGLLLLLVAEGRARRHG